MRVADILKTKGNYTHSVTPYAMVADAVSVMDLNQIGAVLVTDFGRLVGLLTFREVIARIAKRQRERGTGPLLSQIPVTEVMFMPKVVSPDTGVDELRRLFVEAKQRYVPVVARGLVVGVVSLHDVERTVLEAQAYENRMLRSYIELPVTEFEDMIADA